MKKIFILFILFTGCASFKVASLKKEEKLLEKIKVGMVKEEVEEICGKKYKIYKSETEMMEVWFYENFYVGFDKDGKVVKFGLYEKEEKKWKLYK